MDFQNKVVLIIGASEGIGATTAIAFANQGANVVIVGRRKEKLEEVAILCEKSGKKPLIVKADISKDEEAATAVTKTIEEFGKLDILINNAAVLKYGNILDKTIMDKYDEVMKTNVRSYVYITTLAAPYLIESRGNVVNVSSIAGFCTSPFIPLTYSMSKAALNMFTKGAALELSAYGVRVNAVSPGPTQTQMNEDVTNFALLHGTKKEIPLNRVSETTEVADLILFITSDKAKGVTGSNYVVDNGFSLVL